MARGFVSHASKDAALAAQVHRWLVADGHKVFLDQDLSNGLLRQQTGSARRHPPGPTSAGLRSDLLPPAPGRSRMSRYAMSLLM